MANDRLVSSYLVDGPVVKIHTPYCDEVVRVCRSWGGKFLKVGTSGYWQVPLSRLPEIQTQLGVNLDDVVLVELSPGDWTGKAQYRLGWYVLASRKSGQRARVWAELSAGSLPASGGTASYPDVAASADAKFRVWLPRDLVERVQLIGKIMADPRERPKSTTPETPQFRDSDTELVQELPSEDFPHSDGWGRPVTVGKAMTNRDLALQVIQKLIAAHGIEAREVYEDIRAALEACTY